jgi:hypothetical protein
MIITYFKYFFVILIVHLHYIFAPQHTFFGVPTPGSILKNLEEFWIFSSKNPQQIEEFFQNGGGFDH